MHRKDIDGLRTFAVIPVIAFHFGILQKLSSGGFVGVDVFFVISGFLITRMIYSDIKYNKYSVIDFYNRRVRRIFPALFTVYGFCIIATFFLCFPSEASSIGETIISSIFFVSNLRFYSESGYFDRNMQTNPLLHTWSLSVEEQFYVIFPIIIYLIRNLDRRIKIIVLFSAALVSFLYSVWMVHINNQDAAFYFVQFRAWELLIGSLLAVDAVPKLVHQWQAELVGVGGLALIVGSVIFVSRSTPFPGLAALAPCLGAAAVIHSGSATTTLTGRILAISPIRFIGLISYSLYLWHWPIIVYYHLFVVEPTKIEKYALVAVCILLAAISWRFIEKPFRDKPHRLGPYSTLHAGGAMMISASLTAVLLSPLIETVWKYPSRATEVLSYAKINETHMRVGTCFLLKGSLHDYEFHNQSDCLAVSPRLPNFLIIGDSYAAHLWPGLQEVYPNVNFLQATGAGCKPIIGARGEPYCTGMKKFIFEKFLPHTHLDGIIVSARWQQDEIQAAVRTAQDLQPYADRVFIFGPIIEYNQALPKILAWAIASNKTEASFAEIHRLAAPKEIDRTFSAALLSGSVEYVSVYRALCDPICEIWATGHVPLQFDYGHLTREGSIELARKVGPQLFRNLSDTISTSE
jgi:peptidoglycan/LPS O-acetylase OafA/YrhL